MTQTPETRTGPGASDDDVVEFFGQYLLRKQLVSPDALEEALTYQESVNLPLGALALGEGILDERQLLQVHTEQRRTDRRFGEIAVHKGFMSFLQLDELLRQQKVSRVFLGEALVSRGALARDQLERALEDHRQQQLRAEARVLEELGHYDEPPLVLHTLAAQLTTRMLLRLGGLVAKIAGVELEPPAATMDYLLWQQVDGRPPFTYALSLSARDLREVARSMLEGMGEDETQLTDDFVLDVGKEFVNVVVGHICTWLGREGGDGMPNPSNRAVSYAELPRTWEGATRWIGVRLLLPRREIRMTLLSPGQA